MAVPMANHPPFATLNHFAADLGIPKRVEIIAGWYKRMPSLRFNDVKLRSLNAPPRGQADFWDTSLTGFGCRVSQGGTKTFVLKHENRRMTIGRFPLISL